MRTDRPTSPIEKALDARGQETTPRLVVMMDGISTLIANMIDECEVALAKSGTRSPFIDADDKPGIMQRAFDLYEQIRKADCRLWTDGDKIMATYRMDNTYAAALLDKWNAEADRSKAWKDAFRFVIEKHDAIRKDFGEY